MHAIYNTAGFVISSRTYGEAGKLLSIFTRDLGLVTAVAQGIRLEKSKLRYHTQDHTLGTFSLVRGRELWRLTSAATDSSLEISSFPLDVRPLVARIALLLRRLLQGEEAHPELFERVECCLAFLRIGQGLGEEELKTVESIAVLQILHALGYIGDGDGLREFLTKSSLETVGMLDRARAKRAAINRHINKALKESHL